jgi:hypothetical protein
VTDAQPGLISELRKHIMNAAVRQAISPESAAESLRPILAPETIPHLDEALRAIKADQAENAVLDSPTGVVDRTLVDHLQMGPWYSGPEDGDLHWPALRSKLEASRMAPVVPDINRASTKVVAQLANPQAWGLKKLGLVLGYVQSGKTANYTAVMAKAADRGFGLLIVLSGIHNNLREQTQVRIAKDLGTENSKNWVSLTTADEDFVNRSVTSAASQLHPDRPVVIVIKKNSSRLQQLKDWLEAAPQDLLKRTPVLIFDDEADQATPNSATGMRERTAINQLLTQIWKLVVTGSYVGYTATPFANIFMDPDDEDDLYPANFIIDLPRPDAYFGAERLFGREALSEDDDADTGLEAAVIRDIPDAEANALRPPSNSDARAAFDANLPDSLKAAVDWFLVAAAIRKARGDADHTSMLIHTTHYAAPHFAMQRRIRQYCEDLSAAWSGGDDSALRGSYERESQAAAEIASQPMPSWSSVASEVPTVFSDLRVIVDNGSSDDRLDYERRAANGDPIMEVVIAIGGGTLSRGLTLEGLVVSYFTRTSNTYDTLLQMGRWFGYRGGYEDLPRIWIQKSLADDYRFLALVEAEIRADIADMERQQLTPREVGVRVRAHPGRLAIVARNKMGAARVVRVDYAGERLQTFMFEEHQSVAERNIAVVRDFIAAAGTDRSIQEDATSRRWRVSDVPADAVIDLLSSYQFHPDQATMRGDFMSGWVKEKAPGKLWNVVVAGSRRQARAADGTPIDLGDLDLGFGPVPAVNRAPLKHPESGTANIKALLNYDDWFSDLDPVAMRSYRSGQKLHPREIRRAIANGRGVVIIYVVSKNSTPQTSQSLKSRRNMSTSQHLVGLGVIFPEIALTAGGGPATYFGVKPDWEVEVTDDEDLPVDSIESEIEEEE